jgi:hypothetical protein
MTDDDLALGTGDDLALGTTVEVHIPLTNAWREGFRVVGSDEAGYRLVRVADDTPLAGPVDRARVRQLNVDLPER